MAGRTKFDLRRNYDKQSIFDTLDKLIIKKGMANQVETYFDNRLISVSDVSDHYQIFDFSTFAKNMINEVENFFEPEKFTLRIRKGEQELRLIGEEVMINNEIYYKMFNLLNSTDKSKALQINIGLVRFLSNAGIIIGGENSNSHMRVKHYRSKLNDKVEEFEKEISKFNVSIDYQKSVIENIFPKKVSFVELVRNYVTNKDGDMEDARFIKMKAFGKRLMISRTDGLSTITAEERNLLTSPELYVKQKNSPIDIELTGEQVFNNYTELWKNYDSGVMYRETNKILELI
jgi:hypothetical protein